MVIKKFQKMLDKEFPNMLLQASIDELHSDTITIFYNIATSADVKYKERNNISLIKKRLVQSLQDVQELIVCSIKKHGES